MSATDEDAIVSYGDAANIGLKIVEMADRVRVADACLPGSKAEWVFELDGVKFRVIVGVATK